MVFTPVTALHGHRGGWCEKINRAGNQERKAEPEMNNNNVTYSTECETSIEDIMDQRIEAYFYECMKKKKFIESLQEKSQPEKTTAVTTTYTMG